MAPSPPQAPPPTPSEGRRRGAVGVWCLSGALLVATLAAYHQLPTNDFVMFDDDLYVTQNGKVQKGLTGESVAWAFTTTHAANWHPLTWLSHMLDVELFGLRPGPHHLHSLLLHTLNTLLLFLLLRRLTGALWRSALVAALFALHPLHVESVAWVAERKDVLSTLFWLLALFAWAAYARAPKAGPYGLALALFALGLMAKPMLVTLPFTLLLLDFWPLGRWTLPVRWGTATGLLREKLPFFALSAASAAVTLHAQKAGGALQTLDQLPLAERIMNAALAYWGYLVKSLWPASLAIFYPHPRSGLSIAHAALAALVLAALTVSVLRLKRKLPPVLVGWWWFLGTLVPVIGLVQVGEQSMADRYTYVPSVGLFVAFAWGLDAIARGRRLLRIPVVAGVLAVLVLLGIRTDAQTAVWKDSETVFRHTLSATGSNSLAHNNYGLVLYEKGRIQDAVRHFQESLRIDPHYPDAHNNLGNAYSKLGRWNDAIFEYATALQRQPTAASPLINLGNAYFHVGRLEDSARCFRQVLGSDPDSPDAHLGLGGILEQHGRLNEALEHYDRALHHKANSARVLAARGRLLGRMGRVGEAVVQLQEAVLLDPDDFDARMNLGAALDRLNRLPEAMIHFQEALRIRPGSSQVLDSLGLCLARMDRLPEAVTRFEKAIEADPASADARFHLGLALARQGRSAEAIAQFQEALRIRPEDERIRAALGSAQAAAHHR